MPDEVAKQFRAATNDPAALRVRLCMHRRVELPLAFGLVRPTILLPESMCLAHVSSPSPRAGEGRGEGTAANITSSSSIDALTIRGPLDRPLSGENDLHPLTPSPVHASTALRYSLIHEWSHLSRGDVWRWRLSTIVGIVFFYQPLFWWLRRQLRLCQDYLADSHAATASAPSALADPTTSPSSPSPLAGEGRGEGVSISTAHEDYAQFLVSLAHRRLGLPGTLALSVGDGRSNLYRRVQMLLENRQPLAQHLRWPRRIAIAVAAIALIALSSAIRLTADEAQPAPEPATQARAAAATPSNQPPGKSNPAIDENAGTIICTGEVRDALVGKPIAGAKLTIQKLDKPDGVSLKQFETETNADGKYSFELPTDHPWQEMRWSASNRREPVNVIPLEIEIKRIGYAPLRRLRYVELNGAPIRRRRRLGDRIDWIFCFAAIDRRCEAKIDCTIRASSRAGGNRHAPIAGRKARARRKDLRSFNGPKKRAVYSRAATFRPTDRHPDGSRFRG